MLAIAGISSLAFRPKSRLPPIRPGLEFFPAGTPIQSAPPTWFERRVPLSWAWLWRLHDWWRGPVPSVLIDTRIIDCSRMPENAISALFPGPAIAQTNGLGAWILDSNVVSQLKQAIEAKGGQPLEATRVQTSHGILSSLSVGNSGIPGSPAVSLTLLPLVRPDGLDLRSALTLIESAAGDPTAVGAPALASLTNLNVSVRWQLPDGTGFILLSPPYSKSRWRIVVVGSAVVTRP
jgi:hypothetical protein